MSALPTSFSARGRCAAALLQVALSVCFLLGFAACSHVDDASPQERALAGAILNSRRAASLRGWEHTSVHGEPVMAYSLQRTAIVLPPGVKMEQFAERNGDMVRVKTKFTGNKKHGLFTASAAAVADDGYYLTAAHCLDEGACTIIALTRDGKVKVAPARVVWCGLNEKGGPDVGLVHAAVVPAGTIPLAAAPERKGERIFTSGFGARGPGGSGGHVVHAGNMQQRPSGVRWREIFHDAPLAPGDSGGPLIDESGRLLGINTQIRGQWQHYNKRTIALANYTGVAVCLDSGWVQALIANDRAVRKAGAVPVNVSRH